MRPKLQICRVLPLLLILPLPVEGEELEQLPPLAPAPDERLSPPGTQPAHVPAIVSSLPPIPPAPRFRPRKRLRSALGRFHREAPRTYPGIRIVKPDPRVRYQLRIAKTPDDFDPGILAPGPGATLPYRLEAAPLARSGPQAGAGAPSRE